MASAISRFTAALLAGSQENTLALAALNFDFSLYKVEAPTEYKILGSSLSEERRNLAENGSYHITARKLGAIFRDKIPSVPYLIRAYGERVSEIAKVTTDAEAVKDHALFARKVGIDGTAIWAAATSGNEALCVQLLACMLARFWSPQEAVSIWSEVIDSRKAELSKRAGDLNFPEIVAQQANVTRDQLAEWDASARAWLRAADACKNKQQTQLRLIINNVNLNVNRTRDTYESVIEAWVSSMTAADSLVAGIPQSVCDGAGLVGLSAWHLYPDMIVYGKTQQEVHQNDNLIKPGGILTIGLEFAPSADCGVCWSLPLAKLRYYGDPVIVTKTLGEQNSMVSFEQLTFVVLGCLSRCWWPVANVEHNICSYYSSLWKLAESKANINNAKISNKTWLEYLGTASQTWLEAKKEERQPMNRLINFGRRRCSQFLTNGDVPINFDNQMLCLANPSIILKSMKPKERVRYLREVASSYTGSRSDWIIIYRNSQDRLAFATALPGQKDHSTIENNVSSHCCWDTDLELETEGGVIRLPQDPWNVSLNGESVTIAYRGLHLPVQDEFAIRYKPIRRKVTKKRTGWLQEFSIYFGNGKSAALCWNERSSSLHPELDLKNPDLIGFDNILHHLSREDLQSPDPERDMNYLRPLQAFGTIGNLCASVGISKISMDITSSHLVSREWAMYSTPVASAWDQPLHLKREVVFSCIIHLETGSQDLDPKQLKNVMAISVNESIYAAAPLTCDPYVEFAPFDFQVHRALGNIGKPGVSLLVPPPNPRVRRLTTDKWDIINHEEWLGSPQDSFNGTSLHLSLTEYRVPYAMDHQGARDIQAFYQEAVVSIYDGREWVADVDILKSLTRTGPELLRLPQKCPHFASSGGFASNLYSKTVGTPESLSTYGPTLSCVDSWNELLDKPANAVVVRCHQNWLGRLATAALSNQLGYRTVIVPNMHCEQDCFLGPAALREWSRSDRVFIF